MNIFTYGTLMDAEIMQTVTHQKYTGKSVVLLGFERYGVRDEPYPGIVEKEGGTVEGILYSGVNDDSVHRLDVFEGEMYDRREVLVSPVDGDDQISAMAYVVRPGYRHLLTAERWDFETFLNKGKGQFTGGYQGFDDLESA